MFKETGIQELRGLIAFGNHSNESSFDGFDADETLRLLRACYALDLETLPDMLTQEERKHAARTGKVSKAALHRLYEREGASKTGPDWE